MFSAADELGRARSQNGSHRGSATCQYVKFPCSTLPQSARARSGRQHLKAHSVAQSNRCTAASLAATLWCYAAGTRVAAHHAQPRIVLCLCCGRAYAWLAKWRGVPKALTRVHARIRVLKHGTARTTSPAKIKGRPHSFSVGAELRSARSGVLHTWRYHSQLAETGATLALTAPSVRAVRSRRPSPCSQNCL